MRIFGCHQEGRYNYVLSIAADEICISIFYKEDFLDPNASDPICFSKT